MQAAKKALWGFWGTALMIALGACGGRASVWNSTVALPVQSVGLSGSVALLDPSLHRVVMLSSPSGRRLAETAINVGRNITLARASADEKTLFVLSRGVQPREKPSDERPSLSVIDGGLHPTLKARFQLTDPLEGLALDPEGEWAVVYDAGGVVVNPNELILVNLKDPNVPPLSKTIRSFGGRPQRFTFTTPLLLPNGPARRLLIVETEQDVSIIDLAHPERPEVTVRLPQTPYGQPGSPAEVAYDDGDPTDPTDARIAIRLKNDSNVMILELGPAQPGDVGQDYHPTINIADVGGVPSAIAFVRTDGGLRLAALVPSQHEAALIDPLRSVVQTVDLKNPYSHLTRITQNVTQKPTGADVALLWSEQTASVAFWSLGTTTGSPYFSVDPYDVGIDVANVLNVPGDAFSHLKILESTNHAEFYVLDLDQRTSFPMLTDASGFSLSVSPDGQRAWAVRTGTPEFAQIDLSNLHPTSLTVERPVAAVYDIARADGGRAAVALHTALNSGDGADVDATVLDALKPDTAETSFYTGLMLGGLR